MPPKNILVLSYLKKVWELSKPIVCCSESLRLVEHSYNTKEHESVAVVWAFLLLRPNRKGNRFTFCTNLSSSRWILNLSIATGKLYDGYYGSQSTNSKSSITLDWQIKAAYVLFPLRTSGPEKRPIKDDIFVLSIKPKPFNVPEIID